MITLTTVILKLLIMLNLWLGLTDISNTKHVKKDEEILHVAWHPTRARDLCMSQDEIKRSRIIPDS